MQWLKLMFLMWCFLVSRAGMPGPQKDFEKVKDLEDPENNPFFKCIMNEICQCKMITEFERCWNKTEPPTRAFLISEATQCNLFEFEHLSFDELVEKVCTYDRKKWGECFNKCDVNFREYIKQRNLETTEEAKIECGGFERGRICAAPLMTKCSQMGMACM